MYAGGRASTPPHTKIWTHVCFVRSPGRHFWGRCSSVVHAYRPPLHPYTRTAVRGDTACDAMRCGQRATRTTRTTDHYFARSLTRFSSRRRRQARRLVGQDVHQQIHEIVFGESRVRGQPEQDLQHSGFSVQHLRVSSPPLLLLLLLTTRMVPMLLAYAHEHRQGIAKCTGGRRTGGSAGGASIFATVRVGV